MDKKAGYKMGKDFFLSSSHPIEGQYLKYVKSFKRDIKTRNKKLKMGNRSKHRVLKDL